MNEPMSDKTREVVVFLRHFDLEVDTDIQWRDQIRITLPEGEKRYIQTKKQAWDLIEELGL